MDYSKTTTEELLALLNLPQELLSMPNMPPPHHLILSDGIKQKWGERFMAREPSYSCFYINQDKEEPTAQLGDSFLVRKNDFTWRKSLIPRKSKEQFQQSSWEQGTYEDVSFVIEYGITRVDLPTKWKWDYVCYLKGEESPYPFRYIRWEPISFTF